MRAIETTVQVAADGTAIVRLPSDVPPGEHQAVIVIEERTPARERRPHLRFSAYPVGLLTDTTFRHEEIYDGGGPWSRQAHGIGRLLTHNVGDFARFGGLITVLPLVPPP
jgi:hypothetical protein